MLIEQQGKQYKCLSQNILNISFFTILSSVYTLFFFLDFYFKPTLFSIIKQLKSFPLKLGRKWAFSFSLMLYTFLVDQAKAIRNETEIRDVTIRKEKRNNHCFRQYD